MNQADHVHQSMLPVILRGSTGITATLGGTLVSMLPEIEAWLRIGSLLVGIFVGVLTIRSIIKNSNATPPNNNPPENP